MDNLDDLMLFHIRTILSKEEPTTSELELVRKFLNDRNNRTIETEMSRVDPALTAQKLYGGMKFDDLPLTVSRLKDGETNQ